MFVFLVLFEFKCGKGISLIRPVEALVASLIRVQHLDGVRCELQEVKAIALGVGRIYGIGQVRTCFVYRMLSDIAQVLRLACGQVID